MNNRQIKFRIWDKKNNQFIDPQDFNIKTDHYTEKGEILLDLEGKIRFAAYPCGNGDNSADSVFSLLENQENYIIQQYIGTKDVNNKCIYEGDILVRYETNVRHDLIDDKNGIPIYHARTDLPRLPLKDIIYAKGTVEYQGQSFKLNTTSRSESFCFYDGTPYEIIGNILENPELLIK